MRHGPFLSVGLALLAASAPALAQEDEARFLLREGVELRREHRNEEALARFERAFAIVHSPTARAQVALAEQALARWLDAERDLDAALDTTDDPWIAKNRPVLREARQEIDDHLGWLTVDVTAPDADVRIDGRATRAG